MKRDLSRSRQSGCHNKFHIDVRVEQPAIEEVRAAVMAYLADLEIDIKASNRIEVILEELVSNVIRHAREADYIRVTADRRAGEIGIVVEDNGLLFNPLEAPEPVRSANLEDAVLGGQGIHLVRCLSKNFRYDRVGSCNRVSVAVPCG